MNRIVLQRAHGAGRRRGGGIGTIPSVPLHDTQILVTTSSSTSSVLSQILQMLAMPDDRTAALRTIRRRLV
jgi:hypothetical protein